MVSIVQLQRRRTEASAAAASASARGILPDREGRMDLSVPRGEFPIPMHQHAAASPYGGIGGGGVAVADHAMELHHDHANHNGQSQAQDMPSPPAAASEDSSGKKRAAAIAGGAGGPPVKYRECLKNHAAAIGGNATDGCGEFMPSGEEGSLEALKCSACGCHRNFHRKELDDFDGDSCASHGYGYGYGHHAVRRLLGPAVPHHHKSSGGLLVTADHYGAYAAARALPPPPPPPLGHHHQIIMPLNMIQTSESDEMDGSGGIMGDGRGGLASGGGGGGSSSSKKRFRTKFTAEQKGRMLEFAENVGWRLQKLDDAMVQHFCQEIGVKRRVLKVWMHNNKHNLASRPPPTSPTPPQSQSMPLAMSMPMPLGMSMPMQVPPSQPGPSGHRGPSSPRAQGELKLD
ncbi:hypothetical protein CFC21_053058 [Triticum aestivum]|uniref:ZF-HD dimerization-type domain-containing protein n=4 Tax=Triticum TaxID=4564 RepID=A0A9R0SEE4_TRITD|nr:hypothetical protein CFC21_053058 [Triticum aestivum]VAH93805.1 unnamed protein product [Triticum turgidum subsp. durum]